MSSTLPPPAETVPAVRPASGTLMYTANRNNPAVLAYKARANGNVKPSIVIAGSKTLLNSPDALAVDASGHVYVANDGDTQAEIFAPGAHGNVKPSGIIGGSNSHLGPTEGLMIDPSGQLWATNYLGDAVTEYAAGARGNVSPIRTIQGSHTQLSIPTGLAIDKKGRVFVANVSGSSIVAFGPHARGNATPVIEISGSNTQLVQPFALAFDRKGRLLVGDEIAGVLVFNKGVNGNVAPVARITSLSEPTGVTTDAQNHIFATDFSGKALATFAANANGNATPLRKVSGSNTMLDGPCYIALF